MEEDWSGDGTEPITTAPGLAPSTTTAPVGNDRLEPWATFLIFISVCFLLVCISRKACKNYWTDTTPERKLHKPGSVLENMAPDGTTRYPLKKRSMREELEMTLLEAADADEDELVFGRNHN